MLGFLLLLGVIVGLGLYGGRLGRGIAEFGKGVQTGISSILSPQIKPVIQISWGWGWGTLDRTGEHRNGTDDHTNPDRVGYMPIRDRFG